MPFRSTQSFPPAVVAYCREAGLGGVTRAARVAGGIQSTVTRLTTETGATLVLKEHPAAPADWYAKEVEGLATLRVPGGPTVPGVCAVGGAFLLLEDLSPPARAHDAAARHDARPFAAAGADFWPDFGVRLATLHRHTHATFGWPHDNYLGLLVQENRPAADGVEFFIDCRVLRFFREAGCERTLTADDRRGIERLCDRLRRDVPRQPPALCHGDLWYGNALVGPAGEPAFIDPAVHYGLAEAELSLTRMFDTGFPPAFYEAYEGVNPLPAGWRERLPLWDLKELLGLIAQFDDQHDCLRPLRALIRRYG